MFVSCHKTITELHQAPDLLELCVKIFITVNIDERASSMPEKNLSGFFFHPSQSSYHCCFSETSFKHKDGAP